MLYTPYMSGLEDWRDPQAINHQIAEMERGFEHESLFTPDVEVTQKGITESLDTKRGELLTAFWTAVAKMLGEREQTGQIIDETSPDYLEIINAIEAQIQDDAVLIGGFEQGTEVEASGETFVGFHTEPTERSHRIIFDPLLNGDRLVGTIKGLRVIPVPQEIERAQRFDYINKTREGIPCEPADALPMNPWGIGIEITNPMTVTKHDDPAPFGEDRVIIPLNYETLSLKRRSALDHTQE